MIRGLRLHVLSCNHPLAYGRACCRIKDHGGRHSHTWQRGDARYCDIDGKRLDMETGEVVSLAPDDASRIIGEVRKGTVKRSDPKRVLELYGFDVDNVSERKAGYGLPENCTWHYHPAGAEFAFGVDESGHDVEFDRLTGKMRRIYSVNERRGAVRLARRIGPTKAGRKLEIPAGTVKDWNVKAKRGEL